MQRAESLKVITGLSAAQTHRVRVLALQRWEQIPFAPVEDIAALGTSTLFSFKAGKRPEALNAEQQIRYFSVLATVATARVELQRRLRPLGELIQDLRAAIEA